MNKKILVIAFASLAINAATIAAVCAGAHYLGLDTLVIAAAQAATKYLGDL